MATTWYTTFGFYVSTGRTFAFQVQAHSGAEAMWRVAEDHDWMNDMEFVAAVEGIHLSGPEGTTTFAGESTVSGTTIREQPEVFGAPVSSPGEGKTATLRADDMKGEQTLMPYNALGYAFDECDELPAGKPCWLVRATCFLILTSIGRLLLVLGMGGGLLLSMLAAR